MITFPTPSDSDSCKPWSELLLRRFGLALREPQLSALVDLLPNRIRARGLPGCQAYYDLLAAEEEGGVEWAEIMDRLVSHETSFFRHPPSFEVLRAHVLPALRRRPDVGNNQITICSAGCSTGEEAHSLAMIAMSDPVVGGAFLVWGADFSQRTIATARRARYSARALSAVPADYRRRFVRTLNDGREGVIDPELGRHVRFLHINLQSACDLCLSYDVIFCHNVLIYFASSAVSRLVAMLASRLTLGGYLLLGPGEAPMHCPTGLEPLTVSGVRLYRRIGRVTREVRS